MRGSSYIPLPDWITRKKAIVNIRNKDEKCFLWCVLRYLHPRDKNDFRLKDLEKYEKCLNTKGIKYPVKIQDISKFEKFNPDLPGINVFFRLMRIKSFTSSEWLIEILKKQLICFCMKKMENIIIH